MLIINNIFLSVYDYNFLLVNGNHKIDNKNIYTNEISLLIKAFPKDIAALDKRSVLAKVNSQGSGRQKPSPGQIPKVEEDNE